MQTRLKDIAQELGLSITTVSRALAGYPDVAEHTRRRVLEIARQRGYVPNITARQLQQQRTNVLGFIIPATGPRFSDPFFAELLTGISEEATRHGYDILTATAAPGPDEQEVYRRQVLARRVDGMLLVRTRREDARLSFLAEMGFPAVAFGRTELPLAYPWIDVDGARGLRLAVDHLAQLGHRDIAYLRAPDYLMFDSVRWQGFLEGMAGNGLPVVEDWILHGDLTQRSGHELANRLLDQSHPPTAMLAGNDLMAIGALSAIQSRGLQVGRDISVVGFDDIPPAEHTHPSLTTVHQPIHRIAIMITKMLIDVLAHRPLERSQVLINPHLIARRSTGPAPR